MVAKLELGVAKGKKTALDLVVGHYPEGDWQLVVRIDGKDVLSKVVGKDTCKDGWMELSVDLTSYAGKDIRVELLNQPTGHGNQAGYWAKVDVNSP